jgi:hypothetical protein
MAGSRKSSTTAAGGTAFAACKPELPSNAASTE